MCKKEVNALIIEHLEKQTRPVQAVDLARFVRRSSRDVTYVEVQEVLDDLTERKVLKDVAGKYVVVRNNVRKSKKCSEFGGLCHRPARCGAGATHARPRRAHGGHMAMKITADTRKPQRQTTTKCQPNATPTPSIVNSVPQTRVSGSSEVDVHTDVEEDKIEPKPPDIDELTHQPSPPSQDIELLTPQHPLPSPDIVDLTSQHPTSPVDIVDLTSQHPTPPEDIIDLTSQHPTSPADIVDLTYQHPTPPADIVDLTSQHPTSSADILDFTTPHHTTTDTTSSLDSFSPSHHSCSTQRDLVDHILTTYPCCTLPLTNAEAAQAIHDQIAGFAYSDNYSPLVADHTEAAQPVPHHCRHLGREQGQLAKNQHLKKSKTTTRKWKFHDVSSNPRFANRSQPRPNVLHFKL